jgi:hypothetical protein
MSAVATAVAPRRRPVEAPEPRRHLEIAPSRAQRRARPRLVHLLLTLGGIGVILLGQLLLSIWIADGAYQVHSLQGQTVQLQREQSALNEQLDQLNSPQSIAARAEKLGMVASGDPAYLDLGTGAVTGTPSAGTQGLVGASGDLVPNSLVDANSLGIASSSQASGATSQNTGSGASSQGPSSPDDSVIPSPNTR